MPNRSENPTRDRSPGFEKGQRLYCSACRSEVEVLNPSTNVDADQRFLCCGVEMVTNTGVRVGLNVEGE